MRKCLFLVLLASVLLSSVLLGEARERGYGLQVDEDVRAVRGPFVSLFGGWGLHSGGDGDGFGLGVEGGYRFRNLRPSLTVHGQGSGSEFAVLTLAMNLQVDFSPDLWANRPPRWRVTPFVGIGAGLLWETVSYVADPSGVVQAVKVRHSLGDASVHGFGQAMVGFSAPLVKRPDWVVELAPQLRYVFGALDTRSTVLEMALRLWF